MKLIDLTLNKLHNPLGYDLSYLTFSWKVEESSATCSKAVRLEVSKTEDMSLVVYDSGIMDDFKECRYEVEEMELESRTRYYWRVWVQDSLGLEVWSDIVWFETGKGQKAWKGNWISTDREEKRMPILYKEFHIQKEVKKARIYNYGVGIYEAYLNEDKIGEEYLQPGYHSYDLLMEYQTYDITNMVKIGENCISVLLGEGWYKGRFGFDGDYRNLYGNRKKYIADIVITYTDGSEEWIVTDNTWKAIESNVADNGIYDGEWIDDTAHCEELSVIELLDSKDLLTERSNPPIHKVKRFIPVSQKEHKDGYLLLDFGESITGWVEWEGKLKSNQKVTLSYGEILQNDAFYNDNLRTAKAEFVYTSDGSDKVVRPHFTYYGFRYVKAEGLQQGQELDFKAYRLMSDIPVTGSIITSNEKVNRLIENTKRSQKCNFLDIPTDCPQRDERMGWTGDVTIFAETACFHMDCGPFFRHYMKSLHKEQQLLGGAVPFFVPKPKIKAEKGTNPFYITAGVCAWGDVATILPWTLYDYYGDKGLLREQYPSMCQWTDYITSRAAVNKVPHLWQNERQLGDWLALDNGNLNNPVGKTDAHMLASAFYYKSTRNCYEAAHVLQDEREDEFLQLANKIKEAFIAFYFDENMILQVEPTQTACAVLLYFDLYPEGGEHLLVVDLERLLRENTGHLNTGFIGTPILCPALSDNGLNDMAYKLLLKEEYPSWLYEVNMGATTVWERWNSLNEDGSISGTDMNSLNHYAYGSIANWMYRYMCGFRPSMGSDIKMTIKPMPDEQIKTVTGSWNSIYGTYVSGWTFDDELGIRYKIEIPFNANARVVFPNGNSCLLESGNYYFNSNGDCE